MTQMVCYRSALALAALLACFGAKPVTAQPARAPLVFAKLHQAIRVDGPRVIPLAVREDSRCPLNVACAWAGRFRLSVRVLTGHGARAMELTLGQPTRVADGMLELASVDPAPRAGARIVAGRYRFGFRFAGGF